MALLPGKLPPTLLQRLLRFRGAFDRRVVLGPAFGLDAAVIDLGPQYLVLKSDPVTFTVEKVGVYAVHVNANDVAVMGARPAWFQSTIIVPPRTAPGMVKQIFRDIDRRARAGGSMLIRSLAITSMTFIAVSLAHATGHRRSQIRLLGHGGPVQDPP